MSAAKTPMRQKTSPEIKKTAGPGSRIVKKKEGQVVGARMRKWSKVDCVVCAWSRGPLVTIGGFKNKNIPFRTFDIDRLLLICI